MYIFFKYPSLFFLTLFQFWFVSIVPCQLQLDFREECSFTIYSQFFLWINWIWVQLKYFPELVGMIPGILAFYLMNET